LWRVVAPHACGRSYSEYQKIRVDLAAQQLGGALDPELLHFLGAEAADADFGHPQFVVGHHRRISSIRCGHSLMFHRFQSSGKP
jgi:hypothetical protein